MIDDRKITVRLCDIRVPRGIGLAANRKRTLMHLLGFFQAAFAGIEDPKIIQDGGDIRVLGSEMFFIELERVQVTRLGRFLPSTPTVNESDIVKHRPQIGVAHVPKLASGPNGCLVVRDRFLFLFAHIAEVSQSSGQPINRPLVGRLDRVNDLQRFFQQHFRFAVISLLIVNPAQPFIAQSKRGMVSGKNPLRHLERRFADTQCFGQATPGTQRLQLILQNLPKFLFAFHFYQPSLSWLTRLVANASAASGRACSSSEAMSAPTKKLVVPITSLGGARTLPLPRSTSE